MLVYVYKVVREYQDGSRSGRCKTISRYKPLSVGGLYVHLGAGFPGMQRVISEEIKNIED